jgi:NADH pyrophosphatase NudC (nudix superfamily)
MFGCLATATTEVIKTNARELEEALWLERSEVAALLEGTGAAQSPVLLPPRGLIGRALIEDWVASKAL